MSTILQFWDKFYVISLQDLNKEKQKTRRVYQDSRPPTQSPPSMALKGNNKFKCYW